MATLAVRLANALMSQHWNQGPLSPPRKQSYNVSGAARTSTAPLFQIRPSVSRVRMSRALILNTSIGSAKKHQDRNLAVQRPGDCPQGQVTTMRKSMNPQRNRAAPYRLSCPGKCPVSIARTIRGPCAQEPDGIQRAEKLRRNSIAMRLHQLVIRCSVFSSCSARFQRQIEPFSGFRKLPGAIENFQQNQIQFQHLESPPGRVP